MKSMRSTGLTLVELLVVIAVISALAGLTFAGIQRVREKGRQTVCMSNLRQLGKAFLMYAQDNDGCFPPYRNWPMQAWGDQGAMPPELPWLKGCSWGGVKGTVTIYAPYLLFASVEPYLRNEGVWFCPSDPYAGHETFHWCIFHKYTSYNYRCPEPVRTRDTGYYGRFRYIDPSSCLLALDPSYKDINKACSSTIAQVDPEEYRECVRWWVVPGGNHFNGTNQLFLDGHVKWFPIVHVVGGAFAEDEEGA